MEIPSAPVGILISWKGHYYARAGESLSPLGLDKLDLIRDQTLGRDWSAHIVPQATINDLDVEAIATARRAFARKHEHRFTFDAVAAWSVEVFTDRVGLTRNGQPDDYLTGQRSPRRYRNPLLAQTMVQLGMIDRLGYGSTNAKPTASYPCPTTTSPNPMPSSTPSTVLSSTRHTPDSS